MQATLERLRARREELGDEGGFTLIELLIVIVILAILAAIVVFAVQNLTSTSAQSSCKADFKTAESAVEAYKAQMGAYPFGGGTAPGTSSSTATDTAAATSPALAGGAAPAALSVNAASATNALLTGSDVGSAKDSNGVATTNLASPSGQSVGPWLKDAPANTGHYTIFVSNDGSGKIAVLNSAGKVAPTAAPTFSGADCSAIS